MSDIELPKRRIRLIVAGLDITVAATKEQEIAITDAVLEIAKHFVATPPDPLP